LFDSKLGSERGGTIGGQKSTQEKPLPLPSNKKKNGRGPRPRVSFLAAGGKRGGGGYVGEKRNPTGHWTRVIIGGASREEGGEFFDRSSSRGEVGRERKGF